MSLDKLARMTQKEVKGVRKEMHSVATKEDLRAFTHEIVDAVREENLKVLQSNDKVVGRLDTLLKEDTAHGGLHKELENKLHDHEGRLKRIERTTRVGS